MLQALLTQIPAHDLAIQWDVCWEVLELEGVFPWALSGDPWQRYVDKIEAMRNWAWARWPLSNWMSQRLACSSETAEVTCALN